MKQGRVWIAIAAVISLSGCGSRALGAAEQSPVAAEYRFQAREAYEAILKESCSGAPGLARAKVLAAEIAAMSALEEAKRSTPAGVQLAIAKADLDYRRTVGDWGCWADDDPRFAASHVEMARDAFDRSLAAMGALDAQLPRQSLSTAVSSQDGAEFRFRTRALIEMVNPLCNMSPPPDDQPRNLAAARVLVSEFRRRLDGTPYASQFEMAAADVRYEQSNTLVECAALLDPPEDPGKVGTRLQADVRTRIDAIVDRFDIP